MIVLMVMKLMNYWFLLLVASPLPLWMGFAGPLGLGSIPLLNSLLESSLVEKVDGVGISTKSVQISTNSVHTISLFRPMPKCIGKNCPYF